jgi:hypothetical protein
VRHPSSSAWDGAGHETAGVGVGMGMGVGVRGWSHTGRGAGSGWLAGSLSLGDGLMGLLS